MVRASELELIRSLPLFAGMTDAHFELLVRAAFLQRFPPQVLLIKEGDLPDFLHVVVDGLVGEQEIVIKPLNSLFADAVGVSGVTILGDGRVAPIVDAASLVKAYTEERLSLGLASA